MKRNVKVYFSDLKETFLTNIIMMIIVLVISVLINMALVGCLVNLGFLIFFLVYYKREIGFYFKVKNDLKYKRFVTKEVVFDKIETDLKYGRAKRREFFKRYTTPRFQFFYEKELYRIGMKLDGNVYSDIRGKEFKIVYLENTRVIVEIKPLFTVDKVLLYRYQEAFKNVAS